MEKRSAFRRTSRIRRITLRSSALPRLPTYGKPEVKLDTSKQTLASRLNLAPETFSRALHHLVTAGLIEVQGRTIRIMDVQRLKHFQI